MKEIPVEDPVNSPSHYTRYPVEVIELTEHMDFLAGNVVKYVTRAPYKDSEIQDYDKALWYLQRLRDKRANELREVR